MSWELPPDRLPPTCGHWVLHSSENMAEHYGLLTGKELSGVTHNSFKLVLDWDEKDSMIVMKRSKSDSDEIIKFPVMEEIEVKRADGRTVKTMAHYTGDILR